MTNYTYNAIGQMTAQTEDGQTMYLKYDAYGNMIQASANSTHTQSIVRFYYDDKGMRVRKVAYAEDFTEALTTWYVRDAAGNMLTTYTDDGSGMSIAEVPVYGASRIGVYKPTVQTMYYELGDHLGNVRAVIGQQYDLTYTATMETSDVQAQAEEELYFANLSDTRWTFGSANKTPGGSKVVALNQVKPIGPAFTTSVSPGDVLDIHTWAYYEAGSGYNSQMALSSIISAVSGSYGGINGGGESAQATYNAFDNALTSFGAGAGSGSDAVPSAHLNYILFNRDMIPMQYGFIPVTSAARNNTNKEKIEIAPISIAIEGIIYVYVSNTSASNNMVYFDDLSITHHTSPVVFGNDYYPFGLPMDNRQITREDYRYDYQGQYAEKDEETGYNSFQLRQYDARFGRWMSTDPYGQYYSPYVAMGNVPNMSVDPDGGFNVGATLVGAIAGFAAGSLVGLIVDEDNWWKYGVGGAIAGGIAGVASGNITISENATFLQKTRGEINVAFGKSGAFGNIKKGTDLVGYSPGVYDVTRSFNVKWLLDNVPYEDVALGFAKLKSNYKYTLEGTNRVMSRVIVADQDGNTIPGGDFSPSGGSNRSPFLTEPEGFSLDIPKGTSAINMTLGMPSAKLRNPGTGAMEISEYGGMSHIQVRHVKLHIKNSRQFSKRLIRAKIKRIHRNTNGGVLFGKRK